MIKKFNEYINEGFWKPRIESSKKSTKRKEDWNIVDRICDKISHYMAEYMEIEYSPDLCKVMPKEPRQYISNIKFSKLDNWKIHHGKDLVFIKFNFDAIGCEEIDWECWLRETIDKYETHIGEKRFMNDFVTSFKFLKENYDNALMDGEDGYDIKVSHILKYIKDKLYDEI